MDVAMRYHKNSEDEIAEMTITQDDDSDAVMDSVDMGLGEDVFMLTSS